MIGVYTFIRVVYGRMIYMSVPFKYDSISLYGMCQNEIHSI